MKNYVEKRNNNGNEGWGLNFWENPFEDFFKPVHVDKYGSMRTDIKETETGYELAVDMPGFEKKDISVTLKDGYLTVEAKRDEKEENGKNYLPAENELFEYKGSFDKYAEQAHTEMVKKKSHKEAER